MNKTTKIDVVPTTQLTISHDIAFGKMDMNPIQMDVISLLLAEIGKSTDEDSQRNYTLTAEQFKKIKNYKDKHDVYKVMKERVTGKDRLSKVDITIYRNDEDIETYNWFSSVRYFNGSLILHVNPEIKEMLVEIKKSDKYKVFAALQFILPMKSYYSKRIYLMCRNFVSGGKIYKIEWENFKQSLQIPKSYSDSMIKTRVLEKAKDEINSLSDLIIGYELVTESSKGRGGKKTVGVSFTIKTKKKPLTSSQKTAIQMKREGVQPNQQLGKQKAWGFEGQRDYGSEEDLEKMLNI